MIVKGENTKTNFDTTYRAMLYNHFEEILKTTTDELEQIYCRYIEKYVPNIIKFYTTENNKKDMGS